MTDDVAAVQIGMEPVFVNKKAACVALGGISLRKLDELMRRGEINPQMFAGRVVFTPAELRRFATECPAWESRR